MAEAPDDSLQAFGVDSSAGWPDRFGASLQEWSSSALGKTIRTLSLFSGAGGLDIGFKQAGFDIKLASDIDERFTATLIANGGSDGLLGSTEVLTVDIRDYTPRSGESFDFIIGGPPCQTFSAAGRRAGGVLGTADQRGALFEEYVRLLGILQPQGFLFENVYGITGAGGGAAWNDIQQAFSGVGYSIHSRILDAADYGVPQHRERLFIVGVKSGTYEFPRPTHGPDSLTGFDYFRAEEAISGVEPPSSEDPASVGGRYGHLLDNIPPGLNYSFYTDKMGHPTPVFAWRSKFSDFLYKAAPNEPVRTIKAQGGLFTGPFHWESRPFTTAELKRLQTFPDSYHIVGGRQAIIQQIGNSVPPQLARVLALSVLEQVFGVPSPIRLESLSAQVRLGFRQRKRERTMQYAQTAAAAIESLTAAKSKALHFEHTYTGHLSKGFGWTQNTTKNENLPVNVRREGDLWEIRLGSPDDITPEFEVRIESTSGRDWGIEPKSVVLYGTMLDNNMYTSAWKAFEYELMSQQIKDDLVQLCGYYQYPPLLKAQLLIHRRNDVRAEWKIVKLVASGIGVRETLPLSALAHLWGVSNEEARVATNFLRELGYEVRNNNTNPRIQSGSYLIPYPFPSLNPMSVQFKKSLV